MSTKKAEAELIRQIKDHEAQALQELYRACLPQVKELYGDDELARKTLQDALIKLRDDIIRGAVVGGDQDSLSEYLVRQCAKRLDQEEKDREVEQKIIRSLENNANDGWAFYYMQVHYFPSVSYFIQKNGGSEEEAKDIIMDGIEALLRNIRDGSYQPTSAAKLRTYFFQICRNKWYDYLKKKKRSQPLSLFADLELERFENTYYYEFDEDLLNERQKMVAELFQTSTDNCQKVLGYFYYDELSHEEIAQKMGYSGASSSKTQKNKCLRKLKSALESTFKKQNGEV
jgi:RNA polymerase sigma factor (sigma-70 family)